MRISAKAAYACLALLDLALQQERLEPIRVSDIAKNNEIPERFLVQILLQLKGAGYVQSTRGASGGYRLSADPAAINLWDVIQLVDGPTALGTMEAMGKKGGNWKLLQDVWDRVNKREEALLKEITFQDLAKQVSQQGANMFYI